LSLKTTPYKRIALLIATLAWTAASVQAQVIDRILAVVDGAIIMQSDVTFAVRLGLVPASSAADPTAEALDALIDRRLILEEVARYAPPDPAEADVDRNLADIRARAAAGFDTVLRDTGISVEQLRRHLRDDLRLEAYLQQRFGSMQPTEEEIVQYYRDHESSFTTGGVAAPLDAVRDKVRTQLTTERRTGTIRDWIGGLRRRANVNILPR
jgi:hypothetical protein